MYKRWNPPEPILDLKVEDSSTAVWCRILVLLSYWNQELPTGEIGWDVGMLYKLIDLVGINIRIYVTMITSV